MAKSHKDVEFFVTTGRWEGYYKTFLEAAGHALNGGIANGHVTLDVIVHSRAGARWLGGDDAVERYDEDPEASVFDRFEIKVNSVGRVP